MNVANRKSSEEYNNDGWDQQEDFQYVEQQDEKKIIAFRGQKALSILQAKNHSLEPDMISGWRPKLPSCPLPISYRNHYVDSLMAHLVNDDRFSVAYLGPRYANSVQINQQNTYYWRYRERYSLNLAIVKEAVKNIGNQDSSKLALAQTNYKFDSAFESGNLDLAVKVKKNQYDCFIRSDTNTKGHTNWFYFKVQNLQQIGPIKINICNMSKSRNLYMKGMKPYVKFMNEDGKEQWSQEHSYDVVFVQRYCRYGLDKKTHQLQFTFNFTKKNQEVYFAYGIPYTFSDLQKFVKEIKQKHSSIVKTRKLCQSLGGIELPMIMITNPDPNSSGAQNVQDNEVSYPKKKAFVVTARIHPGQSNSSHVLEGFIRQLVNQSESSDALRNLFVFYIVPMLNPDGVVAGNFRTSYSGKDLNRQFSNLNKYIYPEITALCEFCNSLKKSYHRGIEFYFDFHGHSAKKNLFCYGPEHPNTKMYFFKARALAKFMERMSPIFSYKKSIFTISQSKKHTGRAFMLRNLKIPMTFAFEISNGMYQIQKRTDKYLTEAVLREAGKVVIDGLFKYTQLQMRMPKKSIKAKVDSTNKYYQKRSLHSAGHRKLKDSLQINKKKSTKQITQLRSSNDKSIQKSFSYDKEKNGENVEFIAMIKQIKNEQEHVEIEGGSDSEGSQDDFTKDESNNLFSQILKRNSQNSYKMKNNKLNSKPPKLMSRKQEDNQGLEQPQRSKKYISSRFIEMSKPPISSNRNIRRGVSYEYDKVVVAQKNFTMFL